MMNQIKLKYYTQTDTSNIVSSILDIEDIELNYCCPTVQLILKRKIIARCLYTGLVDKYGIEIYEDDYVRRESPYPQNCGIVEMWQGSWVLTFRRGNHPLYIPGERADELYRMDLFEYTNKSSPIALKVVGNKYQNPELKVTSVIG